MAKKRGLTEHERSTIENGLTIAAAKFDEIAGEFCQTAATLRDGNVLPMWAPGEAGALAAERTAAQFRKQAEDSRALRDLLDEAESVEVTSE